MIVIHSLCFCLLVLAADSCAACSGALLGEVEARLDASKDLASTRQQLLKTSGNAEVIDCLRLIATSPEQSYLRRSRAINLLGTFHESSARDALAAIANDPLPVFRCFAIRSLAEARKMDSVATLITKLDDKAVCLSEQSTDPPTERPIFVSDEAARMLELIVGKSFGQDRQGHRKTKPWREWWKQQQRK